MKKLYYGDNLQILRENIADESVDLIYLDPPFNSKRDYNLLFKTPKGHESDAQITAFEDTWNWGGQAQDEFREIEQCRNTEVAEMMRARRAFLGENEMMAYLAIAGLLDGTERPHWPVLSFGEQNFKSAKAEGKKSKQKGLFEE